MPGPADRGGTRPAGAVVATCLGDPVNRSGTSGNILEQIDATITELCACGCGKKLEAGGPSAWFATQDCQAIWAAARADDPDAVHGDCDPEDDEGVVLFDNGGWMPAGLTTVVIEEPRLEPWQCPDLYGIGYRRWCPFCQQRGVPALRDSCTGLRMVCCGCGAGLPGAMVAADVREEAGHLILELTDGHSRVRRRVDMRRLIPRDGHSIAAHLWSDMQRELDAFGRRWAGRPPAGGPG